jgi:hypothetical protein
MFCELPLVHVPLALTCRVDPGASSALVGLIEIELRLALLTVNLVLSVLLVPPKLNNAVMFAEPVATPFTTPALLPGVPNAAIFKLSELQVTEALMSWLVPSLNLPVAVNPWCQPMAIV